MNQIHCMNSGASGEAMTTIVNYRETRKFLWCILALAMLWTTTTVFAQKQGKPADEYQSSVLKWREERQANLRADNGWLTLAGLFWLHEGENKFGSSDENEVVLPKSAPANAGTLVFKQGKVSLQLNP